MPGYGELTGQVTIAASGVARELVGVSFLPFDVPGSDDGTGNLVSAQQVVGTASSAADGTYTMTLPGFSGDVIVVALDEYGEVFRPSRSYLVGDKIRPTVGNETGYVYQCTISGTSGPTEPTWWLNTGGTSLGTVGAATFEALEAWWPVAHAPIAPIWNPSASGQVPVELDTHYSDVALLLHFENNLTDSGPDARTPTAGTAAISAQVGPVGSYSLDCASGFLTYSNVPGQTDLLGNYTFEAWFKANSTPAGSTLLSQTWNGSGDIAGVLGFGSTLGATGGTTLYWGHYLIASGWNGAVSTWTPSVGTWSFVRLIVSGNSAKVWADGVLVIDHTITVARQAGGTLRIGHRWRNDGPGPFPGYIDEARLTPVARAESTAVPTEAFPDSRFQPGFEPTIIDADFRHRISAMHMDGTFTDTSALAIPWAASGAVTSAAQVKFGTESAVFSTASRQYVSTQNSAWGFSNLADQDEDFTLALWVYFTGTGNAYGRIFQTCDASNITGLSMSLDQSGGLNVGTYLGSNLTTNGVWGAALPVYSVGAGLWTHLALMRKDGVVYQFKDGTQQGAALTYSPAIPFGTATSANVDSTIIGGQISGTQRGINGHIDDLLLIKGRAHFPIAGFTPPTATFSDIEYDPNEDLGGSSDMDPVYKDEHMGAVVHLNNFENAVDALAFCADERSGWPLGFFDGAVMDTGLTKWAGGSLLIPSGQANPPHFSLQRHPDLLAAEDFTLEVWWLPQTGLASAAVLVDGRDTAVAVDTLTIYCSAGGVLMAQVNGTDVITGSTAMFDNTWHHVALARSSGSTRLFLDGTQEGSDFTDSTAYTTGSGVLYLGAGSFTSPRTDPALGNFGGYRFTKGVARYLADFTAPGEAFTRLKYTEATQPWVLDEHLALANTVLNTNDNLVNTGTGTSTWSGTLTGFTADSKHGTHSIGIGSDAHFSSTDLPFWGTADFSFEAWVKGAATENKTQRYLFDTRSLGSSVTNACALLCQANMDHLSFWVNGSYVIVGSQNVRDGQWHHVAVTRSEGYTVLKVDGGFDGVYVNDTTNYEWAVRGFVIGAGSEKSTIDRGWDGRVDDVRICSGGSRYPSSFNPPVFQHPSTSIRKKRTNEDRVFNWSEQALENPKMLSSSATTLPGWEVLVAPSANTNYGVKGGANNGKALFRQWVGVPQNAFVLGLGGAPHHDDAGNFDSGAVFTLFYDKDGNEVVKGATIHGSDYLVYDGIWAQVLVPPTAVQCAVFVQLTKATAGTYNNGRVYEPALRWLTATGDPVPTTSLTITNHDFETGTSAGWTTMWGTPQFTSDQNLVSSGGWAFGNGVSSGYSMFQDVLIPAGAFHLFNVTAVLIKNYYDRDFPDVLVQALDQSGVPLVQFRAVKELYTTTAKMVGTIFEKIPAGTARLRLIVKVTRVQPGSNLNAAVDEVSADLIEDPGGVLTQYLGL